MGGGRGLDDSALSSGGEVHAHSEHEECVVLEAKQSLTHGHGWSCLPKKHLAFPFPLTIREESLSPAWFPPGFFVCVFWFFLRKGPGTRNLSCS